MHKLCYVFNLGWNVDIFPRLHNCHPYRPSLQLNAISPKQNVRIIPHRPLLQWFVLKAVCLYVCVCVFVPVCVCVSEHVSVYLFVCLCVLTSILTGLTKRLRRTRKKKKKVPKNTFNWSISLAGPGTPPLHRCETRRCADARGLGKTCEPRGRTMGEV